MKTFLIAIAVVLLPGIAGAQAITSYELRVYPAGGATVVSGGVLAIPASAVACGQTRPSTVDTVNPTQARWTDPSSTAQDCVTPVAFFATLPPGNYEAALSATNAGGSSAFSTRAAFARVGVPATPTNLRLARP